MPLIPYRKTSWKKKLGIGLASLVSYYIIMGCLGYGFGPRNQDAEFRRKVKEEQMRRDIFVSDLNKLVYNADFDNDGRLDKNELNTFLSNLITSESAFYRKLPNSHLGNFYRDSTAPRN